MTRRRTGEFLAILDTVERNAAVAAEAPWRSPLQRDRDDFVAAVGTYAITVNDRRGSPVRVTVERHSGDDGYLPVCDVTGDSLPDCVRQVRAAARVFRRGLPELRAAMAEEVAAGIAEAKQWLADDAARDREYDRREEMGVEAWRDAKHGVRS